MVPASPPPRGVSLCVSETACISLRARVPQSTVRVVYAPSFGFRGSVVGDYPPSAAHVSPTTASSLGVEAVTDGYSLVLVASLLGFLRGGVAGLGLAAGAVPSLSPSSSSTLKVGWRWRLWTVAKLRASTSRSKSSSGFLSAARLADFLPISFKSKA